MANFLSRCFCVLVLVVTNVGLADCDTQEPIDQALACLSGITYREVTASANTTIPSGYRRFDIWIEQPVDHYSSDYGKFKQRLVLLHKDANEPLVLQTSGYQIFGVALSELARTFGANQIQVEHRFFDQSTPAVQDWSKLDIAQSANDFHRIVEEFKKIYRGRWVNTGASKGGMTSLFHHRYFPGDMVGTVADVAPLSFSTADPRYVQFVDQAGGALYRSCREKLSTLQIALLKRRDEILPLITGSFVYLGGKSVAYEHAVIELAFAFWQYQNPTDSTVGCDQVPKADAAAAELLAYLDKVNSVVSYGDVAVFSFMPYYFQAATQLGSPAAALNYLYPYRRHPYSIDQYTPHTAHYSYSNQAMRNLAQWARTQAEHVLFVYGEFDPWSAGAYPKSSQAADFHWFQVPGGNHSAKIFKLPASEKQQALAVVSAWMNKRSLSPKISDSEETLDEIEFEQRKRNRLP